MLLAGIYTVLTEDPGMQSVLSLTRADGLTGVFPGLAAKEATLPYVVMTQISLQPVTSVGGVNRLQFARLRMSCYGGSFLSAKSLAQAVKGALNGLNGVLSDGSKVEYAEVCFETDLAEENVQGTIFTTHCDFTVCFVDND